MRTQKNVRIVSRGVTGIKGQQVVECREDNLEATLAGVCDDSVSRVLQHPGGAVIEVDTFVDGIHKCYHLFDKQLLR